MPHSLMHVGQTQAQYAAYDSIMVKGAAINPFSLQRPLHQEYQGLSTSKETRWCPQAFVDPCSSRDQSQDATDVHQATDCP